VVEYLERVDKAAPGLASALQLETGRPADHLARVDDAGHFGMLGQELGDGHRVGAMSAHARWQGREPLDEQERVERAHRRTDVAQQRDPHLEDIGDRTQRLGRLCP